MGRLISANNFKLAIEKSPWDTYEKDAIIRDIDYRPTAFDRNKVIEQLESLASNVKESCNESKDKTCFRRRCTQCLLEKAIEIVKQGGIGDD